MRVLELRREGQARLTRLEKAAILTAQRALARAQRQVVAEAERLTAQAARTAVTA